MWTLLMGWLSGGIARLTGWFAPVIKDTAVDLVTAAANTPEYKLTTRAESVAPEEVKESVVEQIKHSELWDALHKN
jgi:hypothetical protein